MKIRMTHGVCLALGALLVGCGGGGGGGGSDGGADDGTVPIDSHDPDSTTTPIDSAVVTPGPTVVALSAGGDNACAILDDATVRCWGDNREGQLGNNSIISSTKPVAVMGLTGVRSISVGYEHSCAVLNDGTARCWGSNGNGQLGNNSKMDSLIPVTVQGLTNVTQIQSGTYVSCALSGGNVFCWGRGGDLGDGGVGESLIPKQVPGLSMVKQLSVSTNAGRSSSMHACGVRMDGTAFCWGGNDTGQLGNDTQNPARSPVEVMGVTDAIEITAGGGHACVRRTSGLFCWGFGEEVGYNATDMRKVPTAVMTTVAVDALSAGNEFTFAHTAAGGLLCWGSSRVGQCGTGAAFTIGGPTYLVPTMAIPTNVTLFASGGTHACAYTSARITYCWGTNEFGELGSGSTSSSFRTTTPMPVIW